MNYIISQSRDYRSVATVSTTIRKEMLSDWYNKYHKILAIMSKIFDDNLFIDNLDIIFTIKYDSTPKEIVIRSAIVNNDHFSNARIIFEKNGFKYEAL